MSKITNLIVHYPDNTVEQYDAGSDNVISIEDISSSSGYAYLIKFDNNRYVKLKNISFTEAGEI